MPEKNPAPQKVITITAETGLLKAKMLMVAHGIRHLPVVDRDSRIIGMITDRDIRSAMPYSTDEDADVEGLMETVAGLPVSDVMSRIPVTITDSYTVQDVLARFKERKVGALPVLDSDEKVVGIISERDLLDQFIRLLGIARHGSFICVEVHDRLKDTRDVIAAITKEGAPIGSMLTVDDGPSGSPTLFIYVQTQNTAKIKNKLREKGFSLSDPMNLFLSRFRREKIPAIA